VAITVATRLEEMLSSALHMLDYLEEQQAQSVPTYAIGHTHLSLISTHAVHAHLPLFLFHHSLVHWPPCPLHITSRSAGDE